MDVETFDALVRRAAGAIDRRRSLRVLVGGALGVAMTRTSLADAANAGRKSTRKCKRQRGQCYAFVQRRCALSMAKRESGGVEAADVDPQCVADFNPCCAFFAKCQAREGLECLAPKRSPAPE